MSQIKLVLRPPPNVDFIHGYPGIPPSADRPQAAVNGALEVRVGPQGIKAQWVRIELRKVETLPGAGQANTFFDFVGPNPVDLWQATDEYSTLKSDDFQFYIRIPESIPPTIALDKGAGIKYELIATVCIKGKKGFFRRRKSTVVSTMSPIIIDKHELHSTWPVYQQADKRELSQEGVNLSVERAQSCYGPGDRVSVMATLKSDSLHTIILRGFEFSLKETSIFRAGPYNTSKKAVPQEKVTIIGEQKVPVNATLYGGTQHKAELACVIPKDHTTTSLNAARHIDITYMINVKALMGTGTHLTLDVPLIVSNWPRPVSVEAVRRIGPAPSLSLNAPSTAPSSHESTTMQGKTMIPLSPKSSDISGTSHTTGPLPASIAERVITLREQFPGRFPHGNATSPSAQYKTLLANGYKPDEFGFARSSASPTASATVPRSGHNLRSSQSANAIPRSAQISAKGQFGRANDSGPRSRPSSSIASTNRFTITNISNDSEIPGHLSQSSYGSLRRQMSAGRSQRTPWPTSGEEKARLYDHARAKVEGVQGGVAVDDLGSISESALVQTPVAQDAGPILQPAIVTPRRAPNWPTAEEEKTRLFEEALAAAQRTQAYGSITASGSQSVSSGYDSPPGQSPGAILYAQAISPDRNAVTQNSSPNGTSPSTTVPHYPSAEEEKAALQRYQNAMLAVNRNQFSSYSEQDEGTHPISYNSLYPSGVSDQYASSPPGRSDLPPPFEHSVGPLSAFEEKKKLSLAYETQDPTTAHIPQGWSPPVSWIETRFRAPTNGASPIGPNPPPRSTSLSFTGPTRARPFPKPPAPPADPGSNRPLTAAEEKAYLEAKYENDHQKASPLLSPANGAALARTIPPPPPLMPRPPAKYIQETQAEDAHIMSIVNSSVGLDATDLTHSEIGLNMRPFTPFSNPFQFSQDSPISPPPLPPKVPISE